MKLCDIGPWGFTNCCIWRYFWLRYQEKIRKRFSSLLNELSRESYSLPEDVLTLGLSDFRNDRKFTIAADGEHNLVSVWVKPTNDHLLANNGRPRLHKNKHKMTKGIWP